MQQTITQEMVVQKPNMVEIHSPLLKRGAHVKIIVVVEEEMGSNEPKKKLSDMIGKGKGCYTTLEEADTFIRKERDKWK